MHLEKLIKGKSLSREEAKESILEIVERKNGHRAAALLAMLRMKGESFEEILGIVDAMRSLLIPAKISGPTLDIVGTGGDGKNTVNISTGTSILAASMGMKIAKHGNRAASSKCGSADVLEELGVDFDHPKEGFPITFLFAQNYHPAFKVLGPIRKGLKFRTVFNMIGPLLNPANPDYQIIGVAHPEWLELFAKLVQTLGTKRTLIVHGSGLDELNTLGPCEVIEVTPEGSKAYTIDPQALGFRKCTLHELQGGEREKNAEILKVVLSGGPNAVFDTLALNAAAAYHVCGLGTWEEGVLVAKKHLTEGKAMGLLKEWIS